MPPPAKRGIMRNEFRQPDEQNMRQLLHQHPEDLPGLILRLAWLQGLSREEIVALKWAQVDFQERSLFLERRTVPLEEETAGCLAARFENGGAVSPYVVISDKFREPLRPESVSRIARNALTAGGLPQLQLKDLRRDYFFRQLEQHDWPYVARISGIAVNSLGYGHPAVVKAIQEQAEKLIHISNLYWNVPQIELAEKLCQASGLGKAFFCNSGAEANESAIKLARKYGSKTGRHTIISMIQSFHGRTMGALKATGQTKYQNGFAPLPEGFKYTEANNLEMLDAMIDDDTCAIMLEVIQGEAGIIALDEAYLKHVEQVCAEKDILFIIDEVQTGMGRTGYAFAHQKYDLHPDIVTMAKAIAGGVPMGAMLAKDSVAAAFQPGDHASTFGGNPLAAHTACAVCDVIFDKAFLASVHEKGDYFAERLAELVDGEKVLEVRGRGLMLGLLLADSVKPGDYVAKAAEAGLLICTAGKQVLRFVPPLVITKDEIDDAIARKKLSTLGITIDTLTDEQKKYLGV